MNAGDLIRCNHANWKGNCSKEFCKCKLYLLKEDSPRLMPLGGLHCALLKQVRIVHILHTYLQYDTIANENQNQNRNIIELNATMNNQSNNNNENTNNGMENDEQLKY